jgi:hypothetical protein
MRSPLAVTARRMSRIAKGRHERPAVLRTTLAQIAKSGDLQFLFNSAAAPQLRFAEGHRAAMLTRWVVSLRARGPFMRNRIDIDHKHSRAIVQEIGERLRAFLKEEPELPGRFRTQIDRLRELEEQSPSIIPNA